VSIEEAREARCAVEECSRRMGGILAVHMQDVGRVELAVCREHGDAIGSGTPFGLEGVKVVVPRTPPTNSAKVRR
jgi:hypothetical protein